SGNVAGERRRPAASSNCTAEDMAPSLGELEVDHPPLPPASPAIEPATHVEHNRRERNPDHARPHPQQGAATARCVAIARHGASPGLLVAEAVAQSEPPAVKPIVLCHARAGERSGAPRGPPGFRSPNGHGGT